MGSQRGSSKAFSRQGVETRSVFSNDDSGANSKRRLRQSSGSLADRWLRGRRGFGCCGGGGRSMDFREASTASSSIIAVLRLPTLYEASKTVGGDRDAGSGLDVNEGPVQRV